MLLLLGAVAGGCCCPWVQMWLLVAPDSAMGWAAICCCSAINRWIQIRGRQHSAAALLLQLLLLGAAPLLLPFPADAKKPEDWDDEEDGDWEAPRIANPKCTDAPGCGEWKRPTKEVSEGGHLVSAKPAIWFQGTRCCARALLLA